MVGFGLDKRNTPESTVSPMAISEKDREEIISSILQSFEEYWIDDKGYIFAASQEGAPITGYIPDEIVGLHLSLLYSDEANLQKQPEKELNDAFKAGRFETYGARLKKNKAKFLAKIQFEMMTTQKGSTGVRMTVQDTTYKAVQNHKLERLESQYDSLFHNRFIGVLIVRNSNLMILMANLKAREILGDRHLSDKYLHTYVQGSESIDKFNTLIYGRQTDDLELELTTPSGNNCWVSMRCSHYTEGIIEILLFDITNEKKRIDELERLNNHLDQFIYHASHDLRSPLTTLLGLLQLATQTKSMESIQTYMSLMTERIQHMDSLLVDLTSIAFNEKANLDLDSVEFGKEAKPILHEYGQLNKSVNCELKVHQPVDFVTDIKRLRAILRNLISNSIKYYNPAQSSPFVCLSISVGTEMAVVEVQDNGIGIHPQYVDKVFDMFFRGTNRSSGSGLGLYIVKAMVEKLDGEITLTSSPEKGSTFRISLPNKKPFLGKTTTLL